MTSKLAMGVAALSIVVPVGAWVSCSGQPGTHPASNSTGAGPESTLMVRPAWSGMAPVAFGSVQAARLPAPSAFWIDPGTPALEQQAKAIRVLQGDVPITGLPEESGMDRGR